MSKQDAIKSETRRIGTSYLVAISKVLEMTKEYLNERALIESAIAEKCNKFGVSV